MVGMGVVDRASLGEGEITLSRGTDTGRIIPTCVTVGIEVTTGRDTETLTIGRDSLNWHTGKNNDVTIKAEGIKADSIRMTWEIILNLKVEERISIKSAVTMEEDTADVVQ
jgi:hypothetical protein